MNNWSKVAVDVGVGGALGAGDQLIQNQDEKRELEARAADTLAADKKLPLMGRISTYYNYGLPILAVVATAMDWVKGDMSTRLVTAGAQLAGRKVVHQVTTGANSLVPSAAYTSWQRAQAQANAAKAAVQPSGMRTSVLEI